MWSSLATIGKAAAVIGAVAGGAASLMSVGKQLWNDAGAIQVALQEAMASEASHTTSLLGEAGALPERAQAVILELLPAIKAKIQELCDLNDIFRRIKQHNTASAATPGSSPSVAELWEEAKIRGFTRLFLTAYSISLVTAVFQVELALFSRMHSGSTDPPSASAAGDAISDDTTNTHERKIASEQQAEVLQCITDHLLNVGMPRLCTLIRGAVAAASLTPDWRVVQPSSTSTTTTTITTTTAPPSTPSSTSAASSIETASMSATHNVGNSSVCGGSPVEGQRSPAPGCTTPNHMWQLICDVRRMVEQPELSCASDAEWFLARRRAKYEPFRPLSALVSGTGGVEPQCADTAAESTATLGWDASLLLHSCLDAVAAPPFQHVARQCGDAAFTHVRAVAERVVFKLDPSREYADAPSIPIAQVCAALRVVADSLMAAEALPSITAPDTLHGFCSSLVWDAKM